MSYFSSMGTVWYKFDDDTESLINDISKFVVFRSKWLNEPRAQLQYRINDGELPHAISYKLYDTVDYWWVVLLANQIIDFENQWPRTSTELDKYITEKYPFSDSNEAHHYIDQNGVVRDLLSVKIEKNVSIDADAISAGNLTAVTIYDHELALNEQKRNIILIDPEFIGLVISEYERLMTNG